MGSEAARSDMAARGERASRARVAVAAATVDRADGLRSLLNGLARLTFKRVPEPEIAVVIVDNGATPSAQPIIDEYRARLRWPIIYRHEPRPGLAHARNAQIAAAPASAQWLAMIDDDEVPAPEWLDALLATALAHEAQFVAGPVVPAFVGSPPSWAVEGGFFNTGTVVDGAPATSLYTGNVLVSLHEVRAAGWTFDLRFNHSGGEDEHFFGRALRAGLKAVTAADAAVVETIPPSRTTLRWLIRRYFRMGTTLAAIDRLNDPSPRTMVWRGLKGCCRIAIGLLGMTRVVVEGRLALVRGLSDMARGAGALAGIFGISYKEYRAPDGSDTRAESAANWNAACTPPGTSRLGR